MADMISRLETVAGKLDKLLMDEYGRQLVIPEVPPDRTSLRSLDSRVASNYPIDFVEVENNFRQLTAMTGRIFGLLGTVASHKTIFPGIITTRTDEDELHFTYLKDRVDPKNPAALSPLQLVLLKGALTIQDPATGGEGSHIRAKSKNATAAELGHTAMAIKSLTDPTVRLSASKNWEHEVHEWNGSREGIAPHLTNRANGAPGMFDFDTGRLPRNFTFESLHLDRSSNRILAVLPESREPITPKESQQNARLMMGLGVIAASQSIVPPQATMARLKEALANI